MSILNRLLPNAHLDDAALAEIWTASAGSGHAASNAHVERCAECRQRYDEFCRWLEGLRTEALADAEAAFPAERLAAQQAQIFRRLEAAQRPARVIKFPKFTRPLSARRSIAHRWITVAAAAGLVIGVALGQWLDLRHRFAGAPELASQATVSTVPPEAPSQMVIQTTRTISDEALLSELDVSLSMHPAVKPLRAIDTITPRTRDFPDPSR